jgi:hypothetical protein
MNSEKAIVPLLIGSLVLFAAAAFLPAYTSDTGWDCAQVCVESIIFLSSIKWPWGYYHFAFNFSNLFMVSVPLLYLLKRKWSVPLFLPIIQLLLILHMISWPILNIESIQDIRIGYYVWLLSMILVFIAMGLKRRTANQKMEA